MMKHKLDKFSNLIIVFVLLASAGGLIAAAAQDGHASNTQAVGTPSDIYPPLIMKNAGMPPAVIPETTEILTDTTTQYLSSISGDGTVFTFSQTTPELDDVSPGDVIVGDVATNAPYGFLRKVTDISSAGGQVTITTEDASLEDGSFQIFLPVVMKQAGPPTATDTPTPTASPTSTSTPTLTSSPTPTATDTPTPTATSSSTPTLTPTPTLNVPTILSPPDGSLWAKATFDWTDVVGAQGYVLQISTTDTFDTIAYEKFVLESEYTFKSTLSGLHYWRVYATATKPFLTLLVDDDDNAPDVRGSYIAALNAIGADYEVWDTGNSDAEPDASQLAPYSAVIWFTGDEFGGSAGPGSAGETALGSFLEDGNCLLISSQDYLYDRGQTAFMGSYLGLASFVSDVTQTSVTGAGSAFAGLGPYALAYPFANFSDMLTPDGTAETAFNGDQGSAAVNKADGAYHTAFLGFPIESLPSSGDRQDVLERFLTWCGWSAGADGAQLQDPFLQGLIYSESRSIQLVEYDGDEDGDSLRNGWELHGYDADEDGTIDVDLPSLGASYRHKDIFVEMDYMVRVSAANGLGPNPGVLAEIGASFQAAPVANPDGVDGITIHLELDDEIPYDEDLNPVTSEFNALKASYFEAVRTPIYHYMIWANKYNSGTSSGLSFGIPATSFIVTLGAWEGGNGGTDNQKIGTFIHELGHNLILRHGGDDNVNYKPNYLSIMSYSFQTWGVYRDGSWNNYDYQRFDLPSLNEESLDEPVGLNGSPEVAGYGTIYRCPDGTGWYALPANGAIDWNCDSDTVDLGITVNINGDTDGGLPIYGVLDSYNDWANIVFDGGGVIGSGLAPEALAQIVRLTEVEPTFEELTYEEQLLIEQWFEPDHGNAMPGRQAFPAPDSVASGLTWE